MQTNRMEQFKTILAYGLMYLLWTISFLIAGWVIIDVRDTILTVLAVINAKQFESGTREAFYANLELTRCGYHLLDLRRDCVGDRHCLDREYLPEWHVYRPLMAALLPGAGDLPGPAGFEWPGQRPGAFGCWRFYLARVICPCGLCPVGCPFILGIQVRKVTYKFETRESNILTLETYPKTSVLRATTPQHTLSFPLITQTRIMIMNDRENAMAILHYQDYDRLPIVHFAFWEETTVKWANEDHISIDEARDHNLVARKLGFDFDWFTTAQPITGMNALYPPFTQDVIEVRPDGSYVVLDGYGVKILQKPDATGIPPEIEHLLTDRKPPGKSISNPGCNSPKNGSITSCWIQLKDDHTRIQPIGLYCGSLLGEIRSSLGVVGLSYHCDDAESYWMKSLKPGEICITRSSNIRLPMAPNSTSGISGKISAIRVGRWFSPAFFRRKIGPQYRRICDLLCKYGIDIVSLDCDGKIDALVPIWLENGVNTMFPIEVGVWDGNIKPWREKYGKQVRGVGGMDKKVFAYDYPAIDREIERLKGLVDLGGFIPCPDHRIAPDAKWENVQYYCEKMRKDIWLIIDYGRNEKTGCGWRSPPAPFSYNPPSAGGWEGDSAASRAGGGL